MQAHENEAISNCLKWLLARMLDKETSEYFINRVELFKPDSRARAIVAMVGLAKNFSDEILEAMVGSTIFGMFSCMKHKSLVLNDPRVEVKLAYIVLNPDGCADMIEHVGKSYGLKAVQAHTGNAWYFLPKNSMPVEKEMGLDKPGSLQRIIALEKMVKELKKELESVKSLDNRI